MNQIAQLTNNLNDLKLTWIKDNLDEQLTSITANSTPILEALLQITNGELDFKAKRAARMQVHIANFPYEKTLRDFDYDYQPSINKSVIDDLSTLRFVESKSNILFVGSPGTGKTHLAVGIATIAASSRMSTYFVNANELVIKLVSAYKENRFEHVLKKYAGYKVLVIDEVGYMPIDELGANLFFQLINKRYERKSTILTTNVGLSNWDSIFPGIVANAILDRLVHHSTVIKITGKSYRMKEYLSEIDNNNKNSDNT
jgi:DNA replication protein DnaC